MICPHTEKGPKSDVKGYPLSSTYVWVNINLDLQNRPWHTDVHISSEDESEDDVHCSTSEMVEIDVKGVIGALILHRS